ncbi:MAG: Lysozyme RrrD [Syntrophus sp. SKADARSKE-3]|nr:Lysozyme RrrD [Syntrophus sp. SKADARSKE-3]
MDAINIAQSIAKVFEGFRSKPYRCPAGVPTIGYGSTSYPNGRKVTLKDPPITPQAAVEMMDHELNKCLASSLKYCPGLINEPSGRLGAITDFVYNLGAGRLQCSTLRRRINQKNWPEVAYELKRWVRGGGKVLPGLVARRGVEERYVK